MRYEPQNISVFVTQCFGKCRRNLLNPYSNISYPYLLTYPKMNLFIWVEISEICLTLISKWSHWRLKVGGVRISSNKDKKNRLSQGWFKDRAMKIIYHIILLIIHCHETCVTNNIHLRGSQPSQPFLCARGGGNPLTTSS